MRNRTVIGKLSSTLAASLMLVSACSGAPAHTSAVTKPRSSPLGATTPAAAAATTPPPTKPTGPPPKKGTLAWYVYELPRFNAPPAPVKVETLAANGPAKQVDRVAVGNQKVAFITIDDGWEKDPAIITMLRAAHIPFTMFLTTNAIKSNPTFFTTLQALGGVIEDHTVTHPKLSQMSYAQQQHEICANRATLTKLYGRAPVIVRAPYGLANKNTLKAAASCGIRANVFWDEYAITGSVTWQRPGGIQPGNLLSSLQAFRKNGITPALLENYLVTSPPTATTPAASGSAAPTQP